MLSRNCRRVAGTKQPAIDLLRATSPAMRSPISQSRLLLTTQSSPFSSTSLHHFSKSRLVHRKVGCTLHSSPANTIIAAAANFSSSSTKDLKEGMEVEFKTGGRGFLMQKTKGGWWTINIPDARFENERVVKMRPSSFRVVNVDAKMDSVADIRLHNIHQTLEELSDDLSDDLLDASSAAAASISSSSGRGDKTTSSSSSSSPRLSPSSSPPSSSSISTSTLLSPMSKAALDAAGLSDTSEHHVPINPITLPRLKVPPMHAKCENWIIFSDLHVKGTSIEICEEVLQKVHEAALERNAGIIFLGDFWHVRGALNVELLNRILRVLGTWTQPTIMIPGNHDQVSLGGAVHALEPLIYAFKDEQILMLSEPVVCMGAMWLPYRRDHSLLKGILKGAAQAQDVDVIFCHADVRGAFMNDGMRSREGLDITAFPVKRLIYSGHFHKPHTMTKGGSSIRYVGSPYQTSLSEAGQEKYLYCMTVTKTEKKTAGVMTDDLEDPFCYTWKQTDMWPLNVGKKYIKALSIKDPVISASRAGDHVVIPVRVGEDAEAERIISSLRDRQVEVEVRREGNTRIMKSIAAGGGGSVPGSLSASAGTLDSTTTSSNASSTSGSASEYNAADAHVDPLTLFSLFMKTAAENMTSVGSASNNTTSKSSTTKTSTTSASDAAKEALHSAVFLEGRSTIERLMNTASSDSVGGGVHSNRVCDLKLEKVSLLNFGPYGGKRIEYPLANRGLTLIRGQSSDGTGADSNGSGKTTLAMSIMWGLTGSMDTRLVSDGKAVDVAYDAGARTGRGGGGQNPRTAEVILNGKINGKPFEIIRRRGARKKDLLFKLDGADLTTQSIQDTQAVIDEKLGIGDDLVQRCCFFGQHSHTLHSLLGLTDTKLKSELSVLVDTRLWAAALHDVRARLSSDKARVTELGIETRIRKEEIDRSKALLEGSMQEVRRLEQSLEEAKKKAALEAGRSRDVVMERFGNVSVNQLTDQISALQKEAHVLMRTKIEPLRASYMEAVRSRSQTLFSFDQAVMNARDKITATRASLNAASAARHAVSMKTQQLDVQLSKHIADLKSFLLASPHSTHMQGLLTQQPNTTTAAGIISAVDTINLQSLQKESDDIVALSASVQVRLRAAKTSLSRLREQEPVVDGGGVEAVKGGVDGSDMAGTAPCTHHQHSSVETCPTCGQNMSAEARTAREADLEAELALLNEEGSRISQLNNAVQVKIDAGTRARSLADTIRQLDERMSELKRESATLDTSILSYKREIEIFEKELQVKQADKAEAERAITAGESEKETEINTAQQMFNSLTEREQDLRRKLEELRRFEATVTTSQSQTSVTIALLEDRIASAKQGLAVKSAPLLELEAAVAQADRDKEDIIARGAVLERLAEVLGPRGIQHYVFMGVIRLLEQIANAYLDVLANGGIQLTLQGDEDTDKIVKTVSVRASDGEFKERSLSQLSGGQWRRVSMALDFAFAEVIRRRGTLRSNLIVMDEVLTHLDASGREAVGTVLRAMVEGPRSNNGDNNDEDNNDTERALDLELSRSLLGGGAYDTVIVILQDLSAQELEESFDHIDTVVKRGDSSVVIIDGEPGV